MSLTKTKIEYGEMNWQIYRGCLHKPQGRCPVQNCWAESMAKRQGWDFHKPELVQKNLIDPIARLKPTRILVNFLGDLFGDWVGTHELTGIFEPTEREYEFDLTDVVRYVVSRCPQHTFLFLTKRPARIWNIDWPDNCWIGATAWDDESCWDALEALCQVKAQHKWLSLEPLLGQISGPLDLEGISWVVIGAQTHPERQPHPEWVRQIIAACDKAGVKVWLKDNLNMLDNSPRQEFPA